MEEAPTFTAFIGMDLLATGPLPQVLTAVKSSFDADPGATILIFEDQTGRQIDFDLRGALAAVLERAQPARPRAGPGRPKLGVVAREVSLLPRHWEWLEEQPNGASAALRRLVEEARKREPGEQRARQSIEACGRFLTAMAGNLPNYEEATRALYARNRDRFNAHTHAWPQDIRHHANRLLRDAF